MTRQITRTHALHAARRAVRRLAVAAAVSIGAVLALAPTSAVAGEATSSSTVAARADRALQALDRWRATGDVTDFGAYSQLRTLVATSAATELGVDPDALAAAWGATELAKQDALLHAISQLGVPYRRLASAEDVGFDCSGLMLFAFRAAGVELPRSSREQIRIADGRESHQAEPGDLVYYPGHISMYLGEGLMVHSPQTGETVEIRPLFDRSLRFGDAVAAIGVTHSQPPATAGSLVDRTRSVA